MNTVETLTSDLEGLLARLSPVARRKLTGKIARALRAGQALRIGQQKNPDGSAFAPRETRERKRRSKQKSRVRKMFAKLRTTQHLKGTFDPNTATVGFRGGASRLALEHQSGGRAQDGICLPPRQLLGLTEEERRSIDEIIIEFLAAG